MPKLNSSTILIAPLNWGLGHATRCVPLIRAMENLGANVLLASDGSALELLKTEFPHLPVFHLPSYRIRYQTNSMIWNIFWQLPRILYAIRAEQQAIEQLVQTHGIKGIISDNRYGCFSKSAYSVLLSHQIHLRASNAAFQWLANQMLRRALQKFKAIWIPDEAFEPNLSGALSHPPLRDFNCRYLGLLSRFKAVDATIETLSVPKIVQNPQAKIAVVLSGPEPQRTYLEQILMEQALALPHKFVFVKGKTHLSEHYFVAEHIEVIAYLNSTALNALVQSSDVLICRSGYSSLMDLAMMPGKRAIFIPTPGQTEQEYLAARYGASGQFVCQKQDSIDLQKALEAVEHTRGFSADQFDSSYFERVLAEWLQVLK